MANRVREAEERANKAKDQMATSVRLSKAQIQILKNVQDKLMQRTAQLMEDLGDSLRAGLEHEPEHPCLRDIEGTLGLHRLELESLGATFSATAAGRGLDPVEEVVAENVVLRRQLEEYEADEAGVGEKARLKAEAERVQGELDALAESLQAMGVPAGIEGVKELQSENQFLAGAVEAAEAKAREAEAELARVKQHGAGVDKAALEKLMKKAEQLEKERDQAVARAAKLEREAQGLAKVGSADVRREIARIDREMKQFVTAFDLLEESVLAQQQLIRPTLEEAVHPLLRILASQEKVESAIVAKYKKEVAERKRLFNLVQELRGNIRVFLRCRPLLRDEIQAGKDCAFSFGETEEEDNVLFITDAKGVVKSYSFDKVYGHKATQQAIFEDTKPLITSVMDGYNVCIFAYGQTGSGKTFTMQGPDNDPGVNLRALIELFTLAADRAEETRYTIRVAMVEIYNETIRDLLDPDSGNKKYEIRQGPDGNYVPGLVEITVASIEDVTKLIQVGNENRSMASTAMNEYSSRSHSLLMITVEGQSVSGGGKDGAGGGGKEKDAGRTKSKLTLVDLAGSERVGKSEVTGQRLLEAQNINRSLSALGDVMASLHQGTAHVPYRNSKLTHLLADSLGGDSKTAMFVHCAPDSTSVPESICSLNFATRVAKVELGQATKQVTKTPSKK